MNAGLLGPLRTPRAALDAIRLNEDPAQARELQALGEAANYVLSLTRPHPELGRSGSVCPYAAGGLQRQSILLTSLSLDTPDHDALAQVMHGVRNMVIEMGGTPEEAKLRAILVVLTGLDTSEAAPLVESVQRELKPFFVSVGLMIGEFFPGCAAPGLHNPDFRPLDTSFCGLAVRRMMANDVVFLLDQDCYVRSYLDEFGQDGAKRLARMLADGSCPPHRAEAIGQLLAERAGTSRLVAAEA
ncbi:hypothetical protein M0638_10315 [Roseomonas sp. NAR14]|uniref:DUF6875 domain-containing protein n=1 Tax=Roseomonas acroporae TaxID=2937791 RepID=A0A9X1Y780_9PROT|nr:hypothetical protein [Roseomonas acroporae]MCK8784776.1 hypothetical protein [Roseomonas acroporae]